MSQEPRNRSDRPARTILRVLLVLLAVGGVTFAVTATVAAVAVVRAGVLEVEVEEKSPSGADVHIWVPAALVHVGLWAVPHFIPDDVYGGSREEIARWRPVLIRLADEIERCPEGVLVEVNDGDEHVRIGLRDRHLSLEVETPGESVKVAVPVGVLRSAVGVLPG